MTNYRRNFVAGGSYFFTVNLSDRRSRVLVERAQALRGAFRAVRTRHPFEVDAIVVLPDHLHTIWTLPAYDHDFATRWRLIKGTFSRAIPHGEQISPAGVISESEESGSAAIGNTRCAMKAISPVTSITFTSIR
jgi:putative transposase